MSIEYYNDGNIENEYLKIVIEKFNSGMSLETIKAKYEKYFNETRIQAIRDINYCPNGIQDIMKERTEFNDALLIFSLNLELQKLNDPKYKKIDDLGVFIALGGTGTRSICPNSDYDFVFYAKDDQAEEIIIDWKVETLVNLLPKFSGNKVSSLTESEIDATYELDCLKTRIKNEEYNNLDEAIWQIDNILNQYGIIEELEINPYYALLFFVKEYLNRFYIKLPVDQKIMQQNFLSILGLNQNESDLPDLTNKENIANLIKNVLFNFREVLTCNVDSFIDKEIDNMIEIFLDQPNKKDKQLNPNYEINFSRLNDKIKTLAVNPDLDDQKKNLIAILNEQTLSIITQTHSHMSMRCIVGDKNEFEKYKTEWNDLYKNKKETINRIFGYNRKPIPSIPKINFNVKDLLRIFQSAIWSAQITSNKPIRSELHDQILRDLNFKEKISDDITLELSQLLNKLFYLRHLTGLANTNDEINPKFFTWVKNTDLIVLPNKEDYVRRLISDINNSIPFLSRWLFDHFTENPEFSDFMLQEEKLSPDFSILGGHILEYKREEVPDSIAFIEGFFSCLGRNDVKPDYYTATKLYQIIKKIFSIDSLDNTEIEEAIQVIRNGIAKKDVIKELNDYRVLADQFFSLWICEENFSRTALWTARLQILQVIFPEFIKLAAIPALDCEYDGLNKTLFTLKTIHSHIRKDERFIPIWEKIKNNKRNLKLLHLAIIMQNFGLLSKQEEPNIHRGSKNMVKKCLNQQIDPTLIDGETTSDIRDLEFLVRHPHVLLSEERINLSNTDFHSPIPLQQFKDLLNTNGKNYEHLADVLIILSLAHEITINPQNFNCQNQTNFRNNKAFSSLISLHDSYKYLGYVRGFLSSCKNDFFKALTNKIGNDKKLTGGNFTKDNINAFLDNYANAPSYLEQLVIEAISNANGEFYKNIKNKNKIIEIIVDNIDIATLSNEIEVFSTPETKKAVINLTLDKKKEVIYQDSFELILFFPKKLNDLTCFSLFLSTKDLLIGDVKIFPVNTESNIYKISIKDMFNSKLTPQAVQKIIDDYFDMLTKDSFKTDLKSYLLKSKGIKNNTFPILKEEDLKIFKDYNPNYNETVLEISGKTDLRFIYARILYVFKQYNLELKSGLTSGSNGFTNIFRFNQDLPNDLINNIKKALTGNEYVAPDNFLD